MDKVKLELLEDIKKLNMALKKRYQKIFELDGSSIKKSMENLGSFRQLRKLSDQELRDFGRLATIDGSVNKIGGSHPHYVELFQGMGLVSNLKESVYKRRVYSPIMEDDSMEENDARKKFLAQIELEVGLEIAQNHQVDIIMMDGGLIRYKIDAAETFESLKALCLDKDILLTGFVKEVKTEILKEAIFGEEAVQIYDKDLLYGVLDLGQAFIISEELNRKIKEGFGSMILRGSNYPGITGIDIIYEQVDRLEEIGDLAYSFIPSMSRGVPLNIDMVDKEVGLSDSLTQEIILSYLDRDIMERFFRSERSMRKY